MREAIGGTWLFGLVITFIVFFASFLAVSINYAKAFDIKNNIVDLIGKYEGNNACARQKIGEYLKELYGYRCQICGRLIGEEYGSHIAEAHHIDYFVKSLNNDASNQLIVCPNHHSIIHDVNPVFDRKRKLYVYKNGVTEGLVINKHL